MEQSHLLRAATRALRSHNLLLSRLQSVQTPRCARHLSTSTTEHSDLPPTQPLNTPRRSEPPPRTPGRITTHLSPRGLPLLRATAAPFAVNTSPERLDAMYEALLGRGGAALLPASLKWLAVTHKSFDHGWQGNNDRLAFLGKRIVDLQVSLALVAMPRLRSWADDKERMQATGASGLENLTPFAKQRVAEKKRVAALAREVGVPGVVRWKPRKAEQLQSSGQDTILAHTLYAIVGALNLQTGGEATNKLVKDRILSPLGLRK